MFDDLFEFKPTFSSLVVDELQLYLSTETENVIDPVWWWYEKRKTYPQLFWTLALDYLTIPGTIFFSRQISRLTVK